MTSAPIRRRLAAVVCADVVGYSRMMHEDEAATHATYLRHWDEVLQPAVTDREGQVVKSTGDGFIAVFDSVIGAVECAVAIQRELALRNEAVNNGRRMLFRIGINVGEVIVESHDVFGDSVNLASRVQALAAPGCICVTAAVQDQVRRELPVRFEDLGRRSVKNVARPVHVYSVDWRSPGVVPLAFRVLSYPPARITRRRAISMAAVAVVSVGLAVTRGDWWPTVQRIALGGDAAVGDVLRPPDKPSVAVMPFDDLSPDPSYAYFGDGMVEDIITDLSRLSGLFVIARNSSFYYRDKQRSVRQIGRALGVKYVVEGSFRRIGDQVRVSAQLIEAASGGHIWAERYDRNLNDIFQIQDDISRRIVAALAAKLLDLRRTTLVQGTRSIEAYDLYLKAWSHIQKMTAVDAADAVTLLKAALTVDPNYARADAALGWAYLLAMRYGWHKQLGQRSRFDALALAEKHVDRAMRAPNELALRVRAELNFREGRYAAVADDLAKVQALNPNDAAAVALLGRLRVKTGHAADAIDPLRRAIRLDPNQPLYLAWLGIAEFALRNYANAAQHLERSFARNPKDHYHLDHLAAAYAYLGRLNAARATIAKMNKLRSDLGLEPYTLYLASLSSHYDNDCDLYRLREGLRLAGVAPGRRPDPPIDGTGCKS